jgi:hypothetical protein
MRVSRVDLGALIWRSSMPSRRFRPSQHRWSSLTSREHLSRLNAAAVAFVAFRILHGAFYVPETPALRSASWQAGMLCIVAIFVLAALGGALE